MKFGTSEFTRSLITNLNPPTTKIKIQKSKIVNKNENFVWLLIYYN